MDADFTKVTPPRELLPTDALGRVRLAAVLFSIVNAAALLPLELGRLTSQQRLISAASLLLVVADVTVTYRRGRAFREEPVAAGLLVFGFGVYLGTPTAVIGCAISLVISQSLYSSRRSLAGRAVALGLASAAVLLLAPRVAVAGGGPERNTALATVVIAPVLFAALMRVLADALSHQQQASAREALLARTGGPLLGLTDVVQARTIVARSLQELCALTPGLAVLGLRRDGDLAILRAAHGLPDAPVGATFPASWLRELNAADTHVHRLDAQLDGLDALVVPPRSGWLAMGLGGSETERFVLVAGAGARVPEGVIDVVRTMLDQLSLAEASCRAHTDLTQLAHHDQLTTMPNRRAFFQLLTAAVDSAVDDDACTLMIIDLDDFKQVNDTYGHAAGDELLIEIAARMRDVTTGLGVAARFGGDEFAVLLTGPAGIRQADAIADQLRERLRQPVHLTAATVTVGASIGVVNAIAGATAGDLTRCADIAMYSAKARGKNRVERFTPDRHGGIAHLRQLENHLAQAVQRHEIVLHYQPIFDLKTGRCRGVEALARWQHPTLGLLEPDAFIPLAERHGYIGEVGASILRSACRQLQNWATDEATTDLEINVNISIRQLTSPGFDQVVLGALRDTAIVPARLSLEFPESDDLEQELPGAQLAAIAAAGVQLALDDFGAGKTSLGHLGAMPLHRLKIDRTSLLPGSDPDGIEVTDLIMAVSRFLRLQTVAKNVETSDHVDWARRAGITLVQGNYFAPPMSSDELTGWLSRHLSRQPRRAPRR